MNTLLKTQDKRMSNLKTPRCMCVCVCLHVYTRLNDCRSVFFHLIELFEKDHFKRRIKEGKQGETGKVGKEREREESKESFKD